MMKKISRRSFLQACGIAAATAALTACGGGGKTETAQKDDAHETVTFMAPYKEVEAFIEQVHSVYPEVNVEIVPYSGDNTTTCLQNMFAAGDLPDVCTLTYYDPRIDLVSDKLLDLSGYDFTDNYVESRLQDVFDNGAIYLLPSSYNQLRTVTMNYETLVNIYYARRAHKLDEWHVFCDWIRTLPYAEDLICCRDEEP